MTNMPRAIRSVEPALGFFYDRASWFSIPSRRNRSPEGEDTMRCIVIFRAFLVGFTFLPLVWASAQVTTEGGGAPNDSPRQSTRLDVTRDTWVSEVGREADGNNGAAPRLKLKSIQEMTLIDVDPSPLRGRVITTATLHFKSTGDPPLRRVTVGGIGAQWFEGTGLGYSQQAGGATFRHRRHPDLPWSISRPDGDICHVILGNGGTNWGMADATPPDSDGWQTIAIKPAVLAARSAGLSYGFLVFDDTGSEWTHQGDRFQLHQFPNRFVYSRDQNRASAPFLTVALGPEDHDPPSAPAALTSESKELPPGEAIVSWVTPRDHGPAGTLGFLATLDGRPIPRELIPLAGLPGMRVEMHVRDLGLKQVPSAVVAVQAVDGAGNIGPAVTATVRFLGKPGGSLPGSAPEMAHVPAATRLPRLGVAEVAVIDELDKVDPQTGIFIPPQPREYVRGNHIWNAAERRIRLHSARNEFVAFQVLIQGRQLGSDMGLRPELVFSGQSGATIQVACGRYQLVPTPAGHLPDPIVPLSVAARMSPRTAGGQPSQIKSADSPAGAMSQSLHVELYVPHDFPAGSHPGTLTLHSGQESLRLAVVLTVWDFTLPDHLSFLPEMNCYGLPENERAYYRLAQRHRTVLNRVPYNQSGQMQDGCAPRWDGTRLDWTSWDRRFGPLLDGSAFADLPRKGVPIECFYLPLHENWPSPMEGNYNGSYWADQAFPESYHQAFVSASRQIAEHFKARGWTDTLFHGFLNNKNNFKANGWSRGSSPWLLDEPANFQDYWALRYFGQAFHEGINQARSRTKQNGAADDRTSFPRLVYRIDDSRPQWRRDALDGLVDYHVVGSAMRQYPSLVLDRKRRFGEIVVTYGGTNPIPASNLQPVGWSLDAWAMGADGVLPWQTIGTSRSWQQGDELALFYPLPELDRGTGRPARTGTTGTREADLGVVPSIRLKAYRRGQQDVEYLTLWMRQCGLPRETVGRQVREALHLTGSRQATETGGAEDAGRIEYSGLRPQDLWALRMRLGEALSRAHPAPQSRLVDFRTPPRDLSANAP